MRALKICLALHLAGVSDSGMAAPTPTTEDEQQIASLISSYKCHSVYLDVGSNIGVQIRKLYQPHLYARVDPQMHSVLATFGGQALRDSHNVTPPVLPIFDQYFGHAPRCNVCTIGIEPNPRHTPRLVKLERSMRAAGAGVLVLNRTAADVSDGNTWVWMTPASASYGPKVNDVGLTPYPASKKPPKKLLGSSRLQQVRTVDLARIIIFIKRLLAARHTDASRRGQLVMKVDTEGAEYRLLPELLRRSAACAVDLMFLEWHTVNTSNHRTIRGNVVEALAAPDCKVVVSDLDDETFMYDGVPLPSDSVCNNARLLAEAPEHLEHPRDTPRLVERSGLVV